MIISNYSSYLSDLAYLAMSEITITASAHPSGLKKSDFEMWIHDGTNLCSFKLSWFSSAGSSCSSSSSFGRIICVNSLIVSKSDLNHLLTPVLMFFAYKELQSNYQPATSPHLTPSSMYEMSGCSVTNLTNQSTSILVSYKFFGPSMSYLPVFASKN